MIIVLLSLCPVLQRKQRARVSIAIAVDGALCVSDFYPQKRWVAVHRVWGFTKRCCL